MFKHNRVRLSCIDVVDSNLTISGNFTITDEYALDRGAIYLYGNSVLFLKEPLKAYFTQNRVSDGNLIHFPAHSSSMSSIQILAMVPYSMENITDSATQEPDPCST